MTVETAATSEIYMTTMTPEEWAAVPANDPQRSSCEQAAFYAASREIGRNTPKFVQEARRQLDWQNIKAGHEEVAHGR